MIASRCRRFVAAMVSALLVFIQGNALAEEDTVLRIYAAGSDAPATWSMTELRALPAIMFETTTPFTDGRQGFAGVPLRTVLGQVKAGEILTLRALNDYAVTIPVDEVDAQVPIIAYERNGRIMSVRDKGPLWVVYPFDDSPDYQNELIYSRSVWQLVEISVNAGP